MKLTRKVAKSVVPFHVELPRVTLPKKPKPVIDIVAQFGEGNIKSMTLPANTARKELKRILRQHIRTIKQAVVTFPNSDSTILTFGKQTVRNLIA